MAYKTIPLFLGTVSYQEGLRAQQQAFKEVLHNPNIGYILVCQHHPTVITMGKNAQSSSILTENTKLEQLDISIVHTDRGGDVTVHFQEQLMVYPILSLKSLQLGIKNFVRSVEKSVIDALLYYKISGCIFDKFPGIWVPQSSQGLSSPRFAKICALGFSVKRQITSHGLALNVSKNLEPFDHIIPCGISDSSKSITSVLSEIKADHPNLEDFKQTLSSRLLGSLANELSLSLQPLSSSLS